MQTYQMSGVIYQYNMVNGFNVRSSNLTIDALKNVATGIQ